MREGNVIIKVGGIREIDNIHNCTIHIIYQQQCKHFQAEFFCNMNEILMKTSTLNNFKGRVFVKKYKNKSKIVLKKNVFFLMYTPCNLHHLLHMITIKVFLMEHLVYYCIFYSPLIFNFKNVDALSDFLPLQLSIFQCFTIFWGHNHILFLLYNQHSILLIKVITNH